jgi:ribosomal protein L22
VSPRLPSRRSKAKEQQQPEQAHAPAEDKQEAAPPEESPVPEATSAAPRTAAKESAEATRADEGTAEEGTAEKGPAKPRRAARASRAKAAAESEAVAEAEPPDEEDAAEAKSKPKRRGTSSEKTAAEPEAAKATEPTPARTEPAAKKPARRRATRPAPSPRTTPDGELPSVLVSARARYVRTSPRKARMVCGHLRGRSVHDARALLAFTPRGAARQWSKLLESAVANAEHNHELLEDDLVVREAYADVGPTIKRYRPRALGRATSIYKRTSHLTITLAPRR